MKKFRASDQDIVDIKRLQDDKDWENNKRCEWFKGILQKNTNNEKEQG